MYICRVKFLKNMRFKQYFLLYIVLIFFKSHSLLCENMYVELPGSFNSNPLSSTAIELTWSLNSFSDSVVILISEDGVFGLPIDGTNYDIGDTVAGGGVVITKSILSFYQKSGLQPNTVYYFRIFSFNNLYEYSQFLEDSCKTICTTISVSDYLELFENNGNMPECWREEYVNGTNNWIFSDGNPYTSQPPSAYEGSYCAVFANPGGPSVTTRLVSPPLDLSACTQANLLFRSSIYWGTSLKVYYRHGHNGSWILLGTPTQMSGAWANYGYAIPSSSVTYIAFEATTSSATGVALDRIKICCGSHCCPIPSINVSIGGPSNCPAGTIAASASSPGATSFEWQAPGSNSFTGQGTSAITAQYPPITGFFTVVCTATNSCGDGISGSASICLNGPFDCQLNGNFSGNTSPCPGNIETYQIPYLTGQCISGVGHPLPPGWVLLSSTINSATFMVGSSQFGLYIATSYGSCNNCYGAHGGLTITPLSVPQTPTITGDNNPCEESVQQYSVTNEQGTTFQWQVPSGWTIISGNGTNIISVLTGNTSGNISVVPSNQCYTGTASNFAVTPKLKPLQPSVISGNDFPCKNAVLLEYEVDNVSGNTYNWSLPSGWSFVSGQNTPEIIVNAGTAGGTISVTANNVCGAGSPSTLSINMNDVPSAPSSINGVFLLCNGSNTLLYHVDALAGETYLWDFPSGWVILSGQGSDSIYVEQGPLSGFVEVTPSNSCGTGTTLSVPLEVLYSTPSLTSVSGLQTPCSGSITMFETDSLFGITNYIWSCPSGWNIISGQGTHRIMAEAGNTPGYIEVFSENDCGTGNTVSFFSEPLDIPDEPSSISGNQFPCENQNNLFYSVINNSGLSYNWQVPQSWSIISGQGTNIIEVIAGSEQGNIIVTAENICGDSEQQNLFIFTELLPEQPTPISGPDQLCPGNGIHVYSVDEVSGLTYTWDVPQGWQIISGQGTATISAQQGSTGGIIEVIPSNLCGDGVFQQITIIIYDSIPVVQSISGDTLPCDGSYTVYQTDSIPGATYSWSLPIGWNIISGQGTHQLLAEAGSTSGYIEVFAGNICGNGLPANIYVNSKTIPDQTTPLTGNPEPCENDSIVIYSVTNVSGVDFYWTVPLGWTIVSGQGSNLIETMPSSYSGYITVTPSNYCGNGPSTSLLINPTLIPLAPSPISGDTFPCINSYPIEYSVIPDTSLTYNWVLPQDWIVLTGQGYETIQAQSGTSGGTIMVFPKNHCGLGPPSVLPVSVKSTPIIQSIIGDTVFCSSQEYTWFSITPEPDATYFWNVMPDWNLLYSNGIDSIFVEIGSSGNEISIFGENICGTGDTFYINTFLVDSLVTPVIYGNDSICQGTIQNFSTDFIPNTNYQWLVSTGWTILTGQNTHSITVQTNASGGFVHLTQNNACGQSFENIHNVSIISPPSTPTNFSGINNPCEGHPTIYTVNSNPNYSTTWTYPSNWTLVSGQGTNAITLIPTTQTGYVRASHANICENSPEISLFVAPSAIVTPTILPFIYPNTEVCEGTTLQGYSNTTNAGTNPTFEWYVNDSLVSNQYNFSHTAQKTDSTIHMILYSSIYCAISPVYSDTIILYVEEIPAKPIITRNLDTLFSSYTGQGNQWFFNMNLIAGATEHFHIAQNNGNYKVVYKTPLGCLSVSDNFYMDGVSISEIDINQSLINIFPNPAQSTLFIESNYQNNLNIEIFNSIGVKYLEFTLPPNSINEADLTDFPSGMILIKVNTSNANYLFKVIKTR